MMIRHSYVQSRVANSSNTVLHSLYLERILGWFSPPAKQGSDPITRKQETLYDSPATVESLRRPVYGPVYDHVQRLYLSLYRLGRLCVGPELERDLL